MNLNEKIKEKFYPSKYPHLLPAMGLTGISLLKKQPFARYVIHVQELDSNTPILEQIKNVRRIIFKRSRALWLFREVGACIVFTCKKMPTISEDELQVDKTGFHAVIIQGVHIISESSKQVYNQSKWFDRKFGKSLDVAASLHNVARLH